MSVAEVVEHVERSRVIRVELPPQPLVGSNVHRLGLGLVPQIETQRGQLGLRQERVGMIRPQLPLAGFERPLEQPLGIREGTQLPVDVAHRQKQAGLQLGLIPEGLDLLQSPVQELAGRDGVAGRFVRVRDTKQVGQELGNALRVTRLELDPVALPCDTLRLHGHRPGDDCQNQDAGSGKPDG